jgi:DNA invertase Pin-like site-specific DNA recombinase
MPQEEFPTVKSNRAVLYLRVSTQEQAASGHSLAGQERELGTYCQFRGLEVVDVLTDAGVSGTKPLAKRTGGARLLALVAAGDVGHVVLWKLDRAFRNVFDCLETVKALDEAGVSLHITTMGGQAVDTNSPMGRFMLVLMAGLAQFERDQLIERTNMGLDAARAKGVKIGRQSKRDPKLIEFVVEQYKAGVIASEITRRADKKGFRGHRGARLRPEAIFRILRTAGEIPTKPS